MLAEGRHSAFGRFEALAHMNVRPFLGTGKAVLNVGL
jgi:hypothetical protein